MDQGFGEMHDWASQQFGEVRQVIQTGQERQENALRYMMSRMSMNVPDFFQPYTQPGQFSMPGQFRSSGEGGSSQFIGYGYGLGQYGYGDPNPEFPVYGQSDSGAGGGGDEEEEEESDDKD
ncbi:hypothetical protein Hanom_Chr13g01204611 [Helianthus anomalus]